MRPEFPAIAFIAAATLLLPLPWHWRARNVSTLSLIFWLFLMNMIYGIDAIVWGNTAEELIPVWCDITTKLIIGSTFALPAGCLCICIHLEKVSSEAPHDIRSYYVSGAAVVMMVLHYIVQGHRFDIIEEYGCRPATYYSIPALFIVWIPPIVMAFACLIYAGCALRHFMIRRATFAAHLNSPQSALTASRYLRLILMSIFQMTWSIIMTSYTLWYTAMAIPLRPWTTWADVHSNFARAAQFPKVLLAMSPKTSTAYYFSWWAIPMSTFVFVAFFAFGKEAVDDYRKCWVWIKRNVFRMQANTGPSRKGLKQGSRRAGIEKDGISLPSIVSPTSTFTPPRPPTPKKYHSSLDEPDFDLRSETETTYLGSEATQKSLRRRLPPLPLSPQPR
ncbi:STE3-domain-containing protein [Hymenopellis radicata]|nr:STE3-domain-containing protein [Hymenopellis radicata]